MPQKKVSQTFFATFRIKMHSRRKKKALSSRRVEIQNWAMPWHAWAKNRLDCSFSFCLHFCSIAVIRGGLFRLRSINRLLKHPEKGAIEVIWKNKSNNRSTILNTVVMSTIFTSTHNSYKWLKYYFNIIFIPIIIFSLTSSNIHLVCFALQLRNPSVSSMGWKWFYGNENVKNAMGLD